MMMNNTQYALLEAIMLGTTIYLWDMEHTKNWSTYRVKKILMATIEICMILGIEMGKKIIPVLASATVFLLSIMFYIIHRRVMIVIQQKKNCS